VFPNLLLDGSRGRPLEEALTTLRRFIRDDEAQDVVEYGLIAAFVGVAGYVALGEIGVAVFNTYSSWVDPAAGVPSLWDPAEPAGGGS